MRRGPLTPPRPGKHKVLPGQTGQTTPSRPRRHKVLPGRKTRRGPQTPPLGEQAEIQSRCHSHHTVVPEHEAVVASGVAQK
eukprot:2829374-Amphidinium_carterae.1